MHGTTTTSKKRPNDVGVIRHFKRPPEADQCPKSALRVTPTSTGGPGTGERTRQQSAAAGNPSKRHRERLNTELDAVAALLPFESGIIARLDKLSVLRLAVSFLEAKTFFQVLQQRHYARWPFNTGYSSSFLNPRYFAQEQSILKALGGFIVILNENGDIIYATENIETLLGFHQSDTLHQPIFDMVHSEDRDELRRMLSWNYSPSPYGTETADAFLPATDAQILMERQTSVRFRCFLDNTCGFMRVDIRGRLVILESCLPHCYIASRPEPNFPIFGLLAVCIPLVMPSHVDASPEEPFLRSKHALNFAFCSADPKLICALEIADDGHLSSHSLYTFSDARDLSLVAEAHKQVIQNGAAGLLVYRLISKHTQKTYWFQSSCRLMMKNGKPDSITCSHRLLTEYEGAVLLSKRSALAAKVLVLEDNMSSAATPMNLLYGCALTTPPTATHHSTNASALIGANFRTRQQASQSHQHQHGTTGGISNAAPTVFATKSTFRFRSSGKRSRNVAAKAQQQEAVAREHQSAISPNQQQQQQLTSTTTPLPPYLLYPQGRQARVSPGTGFLPYYLQLDGSQQQQPAYGSHLRHYSNQQQPVSSQSPQATEFQLHYHLHQHYGPPYQNNSTDINSLTKQALSPNPSVQQEHQQQTFAVEPISANHIADHGTAAFWLYSPNQGQPATSALPMEHRAKGAFSIQEVTNTLLSQ